MDVDTWHHTLTLNFRRISVHTNFLCKVLFISNSSRITLASEGTLQRKVRWPSSDRIQAQGLGSFSGKSTLVKWNWDNRMATSLTSKRGREEKIYLISVIKIDYTWPALIVLRSVGLMRSLQMRIKVADKFALPRRYRYVKCKGSWYLKRRRHGNVALWGGNEGLRKSAHGRMKSLASITVTDPGGARGGSTPLPLFSDQIAARRAEIFFFWDWSSPLFSGCGWQPNPPPPYLKIRHCVIDVCF